MKSIISITFLSLLLISTGGWTAEKQTHVQGTMTGHIMVFPKDIEWKSGPAALPAGAEMAVIEGDPTKPGLFTMRVKVPANYQIPPHWHPADEHVTVISGALGMGLGEKFDESKAREIPAGGFAVMSAGTRHFAFSKVATVIQLHGVGPWGINYVNPADDPRKAEKMTQ